MNVSEYKNKRINEIKKLLNSIHFENIGIPNKPIIENLTPETNDFFNIPSPYRIRTELLLKEISEYKTELIETKLEFISLSQEGFSEIDGAIEEFITKTRLAIERYKHDIIKIVFAQSPIEGITFSNLPEVKEKNLINTGLNFIKIKLGANTYSLPKTGNEAENEDAIIDDLSIMIIYIYILKLYIEDKKRKYEEFNDFITTNFDIQDKEYIVIRKMQSIFLNEKNYEIFVEKYNLVAEELVTMAIDKSIEEENNRKNQNRKGSI